MTATHGPEGDIRKVGARSLRGQEDHPGPPDDGGERVGVHVYGGKAALCFEADETRGGVPTIALDAAAATGPKQYDWRHKVRLQLTKNELPAVLSVLVGFVPKAECRNHGPDNDKGFAIEHQGDKLFVRVWAKDQGVKAVPIPLEDAFYVTELFLRQLCKAAPWMTAGDILKVASLVLPPRTASHSGDGKRLT